MDAKINSHTEMETIPLQTYQSNASLTSVREAVAMTITRLQDVQPALISIQINLRQEAQLEDAAPPESREKRKLRVIRNVKRYVKKHLSRCFTCVTLLFGIGLLAGGITLAVVRKHAVIE